MASLLKQSALQRFPAPPGGSTETAPATVLEWLKKPNLRARRMEELDFRRQEYVAFVFELPELLSNHSLPDVQRSSEH